MSVIAPPAPGITRRRDNPRRKAILPVPTWVIDSAGALLSGRAATGLFRLHHLQDGILDLRTRALPRAAVLPAARQLITVQSERWRPSIRGLVRARVQAHQRIAPDTWRCSHATGPGEALSVPLPRPDGVCRLAR